MAKTDPLAAATRKTVATQIGSFLQSAQRAKRKGLPKGAKAMPGLTGPASPKLAEDFAYCTVSLQDVLTPPADPAALLAPSGMWIHLVADKKKMTHFALSRDGAFEGSPHEVVSVVRGPLAEKLDEAIRWIDEEDKDDGAVVRVLSFPAFYTHAFGILRGGEAFAVLVDQPTPSESLKPRTEYPLKEFLDRLREEPHT